MIDQDKILTALYSRLRLMGGEPVYKVSRPRKPDGSLVGNPCYTCNFLSLPKEEKFNIYHGTIVIVAYVNDSSNGASNSAKLSAMIKMAGDELNGKPIKGDGFYVYAQYILSPSGVLKDAQYPDEHYMSLRIKIHLKEE